MQYIAPKTYSSIFFPDFSGEMVELLFKFLSGIWHMFVKTWRVYKIFTNKQLYKQVSKIKAKTCISVK